MKKLYSLLATAMLAITAFGQTTLLSESFGTTAILPTGWSSTNTINGWKSNSSSASTTKYPGASGGMNVVFVGQGPNNITHTLTYSNLATIGYTNISIIWGGLGAAAFNQDIVFQWSTDGTTWNDVAYSYNKKATTWSLINNGVPIQLPAGAGNAATLSLRWFSVTSNSGNYRIDDIKVEGISGSLATSEIIKSKNIFVKNTFVENEIYFGTKSEIKIFNISGELVKTASVFENESVNVENLQSGIYLVTGNSNGKAISEKIMKK
ncbi:Por secretion system C-terminal sorting domain [Chryseobacterium nakagawai]|uniref:T9SS C-terminal target domain-containing protein n=1 Tax=Chryseobacterium nakagawai TaxID=1241982 RepID=A0AAD0YLT7_CHRNA|nr:T9SS type A sorting domain-containing protein [Chryseobacterium nakagawai]AZA90879.1 T9SS C-terminal target domain-containing protein [Chryseobacterium nakagawai]VEH22416.1 Por secretion system C-terminal sorting domain [Chryseobacterium nakagawai]